MRQRTLAAAVQSVRVAVNRGARKQVSPGFRLGKGISLNANQQLANCMQIAENMDAAADLTLTCCNIYSIITVIIPASNAE